MKTPGCAHHSQEDIFFRGTKVVNYLQKTESILQIISSPL